jgi:hypothetical protein
MRLFISGSGLLLNIPPGYRQVGLMQGQVFGGTLPKHSRKPAANSKTTSCLCNHSKAMRENFASTNMERKRKPEGVNESATICRKHLQIRHTNAILLSPLFFTLKTDPLPPGGPGRLRRVLQRLQSPQAQRDGARPYLLPTTNP